MNHIKQETIQKILDFRDSRDWKQYHSGQACPFLFILGYYRDKETGRASKFFISKLIDKELKEMKFIDEKSHGFLDAAKIVELQVLLKNHIIGCLFLRLFL